MNWKEQQRALSARARQVGIHTGDKLRQPGARLRFADGTVMVRQPDGSLRSLGKVAPQKADSSNG